MNELQVIHQSEVLGEVIDVYGSAEEPLFLARDVAEWIDYDKSSVHKMLANVDEDEKVRKFVPTLGGKQAQWMLTEDGLYETLMLSKKGQAKRFKKEVKKILKMIRLTGGYVAASSEERFIDTYFPSLSEETKKAMVTDLNQKNKELHEKLEAQKPLVAFAEVIEKSQDSLLVREFAKAISKRGFVIGERKLFHWLRERKYLDRKNMPYQRFIDQGLFEVTETPVPRSTGIMLSFTSRITAKGQIYFYNKLTQEETNHG